jgi:acetoin utilization deacetylase AcuC-like enzyme/ankyrin repeat protein
MSRSRRNLSFSAQSLILEAMEEEPEPDDDEEDDDEEEGPHPADKDESEEEGDDGDEASSSDDNDSTAAAHAAAIGHSPLPLKVSPAPATSKESPVTTLSDSPPVAETPSGKDEQEDKEAQTGMVPEVVTTATPDEGQPMQVDDEEKPLPAPQNGGVGEEAPAVTDNESKPTVEDHDMPEAKPADAPPSQGADTLPVLPPSPPVLPKKRIRYRLIPGANLNERDDDENTPLHVAIHARKLEHVKVLLEWGASWRLRCDGSFAIHTAISLGAVSLNQQFAYDCVVALHEAGADLTTKDDANHTPLYLACMYNLPQIVNYILSDEEGLSTLNARSDRASNRPIHAAAKFDTLTNASKASAATSLPAEVGGVVKAMFPGKIAHRQAPTEALVTQLLLNAQGVEVDGANGAGQTALHVACSRGNWPVVKLLLQAGSSGEIADRRGYLAGQLAYKRGMPIPADLVESLGEPPARGNIPPVRDLLVDPNSDTVLLTHELCILHRTCPPIIRDSAEPPPENVRRLNVLVDPETGILRTGEFRSCHWKNEARRAAISDVLKVHEYAYVERISQMSSSIPDHASAIAHVDPDTTVSRWSFEAAMRAAGSICEAVDLVVHGEHRNSFCAVRPPGHHAGPRGVVKCPNDTEGSHGFCLLNNVAIGAAYARSMYRNEGIRKVAIIDFDVHHGNGTEEIIRQLVPTSEKATIRTPFAFGEISSNSYRPWLDETDIQNVFFSSTHGFGQRGHDLNGWFYPASGKTHTSEAISHPSMVDQPNLTDFMLSQTWSRMGEESKANCCKIINVGFDLPPQSSDPVGRTMKQRLDLRDTYRNQILPALRDFDPDIIFISAGFDAHRRDAMNFGYVGMVEDDYEWVTDQLVKVANTCCNGRVVSVLEGGYKIHGGIVSPFARSVASHVRALVDGGHHRELYDSKDLEWESQYERHIFDRRERKKEEDREKLLLRMEAAVAARPNALERADEDPPEDPDAPSRKRRRNQVDYKELFRQMQEEGFAK